jgi:hypothetical protein
VEARVARRLLIEREGLWIEGGGKGRDLLRVDPQPPGAERLPQGKIFEISSSHGSLSPLYMAARGRGQPMGPNQAPRATATALIRPKAASAALKARKTSDRSPLQRSAKQFFGEAYDGHTLVLREEVADEGCCAREKEAMPDVPCSCA